MYRKTLMNMSQERFDENIDWVIAGEVYGSGTITEDVKTHADYQSKKDEITAEYKYTCKNETTLSAVEVKLTKVFPGIEKLKVYWLTDSMQGSIDLTGKSDLINIR